MGSFHNNQLKMVGLFDSDETYYSPGQAPMVPWPSQSNSSHFDDAGVGYFHNHESTPQVKHGFASRSFQPDHFIADSVGSQYQKQDDGVRAQSEDRVSQVSYTPGKDSEDWESACEDRLPSKTTKINKDGAPRKPRQPRPKLLKWTDNDWKNAVLGIVWSCGEKGIQIPFEQAAQVVGKNCTASALQQAVLKLRGKQVADGNRIPTLKMAWTRKNRSGSSPTPIANTQSTQVQSPIKTHPCKRADSLIVKLKIARRGVDSMRLETAKQPEIKLPSDMFPCAQHTTVQQSSRQAHLHSTQQPQEVASKVEHYNANDGINMNYSYAPPYANPESQVQMGHDAGNQAYMGFGFGTSSLPNITEESAESVQQRKLYNRNHIVFDDLLIDQDDFIMGTTDQLRSFEGIVTPENNPFESGFLTDMPNQATQVYGNPYGGNAEYSQESNPVDHRQLGSVNLSEFTDYAAYSAGDNNQEPLGDIFKAEAPELHPYSPRYFD
ncbi:hypothetical protein COCMIDRAFT_35194 [Bipolaris oryzae ATCC 44560]|uniref:Uncharacterized protein n=1 Tax=Bipolaris oryzae ATCC 44560 TaxID=930090 RepID=W6ZU29_COCMI|nr:uncharacterized protein COCMIDRAFT_35194 [Bipolaris oryzae ATCC 44560]EUC47191.1 hypothetical protein COCMIDRAFT_35194 [Bipolaris oryzae ATCC 44560]